MKIAAAAFSLLIIVFLLAPFLVLIPMSFGSADIAEFPPRTFSVEQYKRFLESKPWVQALFTSLRVAVATMAISTTLGTMAAFGLVRGRFPGITAISSLLIAPRFVPIIITALAYYAFLVKIRLIGTEYGLVLAHTILACPYVIIIVSSSLRGFDRSLEQASRILGASPIQTTFRVTLPLIRPGVISAALFAFMFSFDEIVVAIFVCGTHTETLPKRMWDSLTYEMEPTLPAISTLILVATILVFMTAGWAQRTAARLRSKGGDAEKMQWRYEGKEP
jgi:ABC-type spermidine/putrescine transport system permease subunit II